MSLKSIFRLKFLFKKDKENCWDRTLRWLLLGIVFLVPIFFLTPNSHPIEFNKVLLFDILVLVTAFIFLLKTLISGKFSFAMNKFHLLVAAFFVFYLISFVFTKNYYSSLVGISGFYSASIFSVFCFILFFYLVISIVRSKEDIIRLIVASMVSAGIVAMFNILQVNGINLLPWEVTQNSSFNLIGSSSLILAVYTAVYLLISFGLFLFFKKKWQVAMCGALTLVNLFLIFVLNKNIAFYILALGLFMLLILITFKSKQLSNWWVLVPTIVLTVVVLFIFVDSQSLTSTQVSDSILLDDKTSASIAWQSFKKAPLWGSGPQTFNYDFSMYRPVEFNNSELWNLRFIKSSNEWFGLIATIGLGGTLAFLLMGLWFLVKHTLSILSTKKITDNWKLSLIVLISWFILFISSFLLPFNFILSFVWWLLLGLGFKFLLLDSKKEKEFVLKKSSKPWLIALSAFIVVTAGTIMVIFFGTKLWLADYNFVKAQQGIGQQEEIDAIEGKLQRAINYNSNEVKYYFSLAQGYVTQAQLEAYKEEPNIELIQRYSQKVLDLINQVKLVDPNNPAVYEQEASLYDSMRNLISNVDDLSITAYSSLVTVDPINPLARLNLGRSRLLQAQGLLSTAQNEEQIQQANQLIKQAIDGFDKAKEFKEDFVMADTNLVLAYEVSGDYDRALIKLQEIILLYPDNIDLLWEAVLIYEKQGQIDKAIAQLEAILKLSPDNSIVQDKLTEFQNPPEAIEEVIE